MLKRNSEENFVFLRTKIARKALLTKNKHEVRKRKNLAKLDWKSVFALKAFTRAGPKDDPDTK